MSLSFRLEKHREMHVVLLCDNLLVCLGQIDYKAVSDTCNIYKVYPDMIDSWLSLHDVVKYFGDNYRDFQNYSKAWQLHDDFTGKAQFTAVSAWM